MYSLYLVPVCPANIILVWKKQKPVSGENQLPLLQWGAMMAVKNPASSVGEGKGGIIRENSIETCILLYVKQTASSDLMHETGCSGLVHWDDAEGWYGEGDGRGVQDREHMDTHG